MFLFKLFGLNQIAVVTIYRCKSNVFLGRVENILIKKILLLVVHF